jgi:hypothetical protein
MSVGEECMRGYMGIPELIGVQGGRSARIEGCMGGSRCIVGGVQDRGCKEGRKQRVLNEL